MSTLVTYASIGGNTMMVAQKIEEVLKQNGHETQLVDMYQLEPEQLTEHPIVFIGSSTWDDGYNSYSQDFFDKLKDKDIDLSNTNFCIYGCGESFYPLFCITNDFMIRDLGEKKGQIVGKPLTVDGFPDDAIMESVEQWVVDMLKLL
jgi:flavodoxin